MTKPASLRPNPWRLRAVLAVGLLVLLIATLLGSGAAGAGRLTTDQPAAPTTTTTGPVTTASTTALAASTTTTPTLPPSGCGLTLTAVQSTTPAVTPWPGHCTVVEIGDSLGSDLGWGLARQTTSADGFHLIELDRPDSGLSNPWFYDWPAHLATALTEYHPQLVLVCLGGNDEQGMTVNGKAVQFPTRAWQQEYLSRIQQLLAEADARGAFVLWVGLPPMAQPSYSSGIAVLNRLYSQATASTAGAAYISSWSLFSNPSGAFSTWATVDGEAADLRASDGIHMGLAGENVMATYVLDQMAALFHVELPVAAPAVITSWPG